MVAKACTAPPAVRAGRARLRTGRPDGAVCSLRWTCESQVAVCLCRPSVGSGSACPRSLLVAFRFSLVALCSSIFDLRSSIFDLRSSLVAGCWLLQRQQRFGLSAESLLFGWPDGQREVTKRKPPHFRAPGASCTRGPLRCSRLAGRCATRTSLCSNMLAFPCKSLRSSALHRGPHSPSTRHPAWSSRPDLDSRCSARSGAKRWQRSKLRSTGAP